MSRTRSLALPLVTIALCTTTLVAICADAWSHRAGTLPAEPLDALRRVHRQILKDYLYERDPDELVYRAIEEMVKSLDKYCCFVRPDEVREFEGLEINGTFEGIGVVLVDGQASLTVRWPLAGGPAAAAGLRVGDRILAIDGATADPTTARRRLRGPAGSRVALRIARGADEPFDVELERADVPRPAVKWAHLADPKHRIGYVYVAAFQRGMVGAFDREVARLAREAGGALAGLIVDVRGNPGGLLTEAVALTNRLLPSGRIVRLARRDGRTVETHDAQPSACTLPDVPAVVLVDRSSASAAEVFAAALQDHRRAQVIGERTFGKGVVQEIYAWRGHDYRLKMTSSRYYTPNGRSLESTLRSAEDPAGPGGVDPDTTVVSSAQEIDMRERALALEPPPPELADEVRALGERLGFEVPEPPDAAKDPCLAAGLELLRVGAGGR